MAQQPKTDERTAVKAPENENSTITVALAMGSDDSHDAVEHGAPVADHPSADDSLLVAGSVECVYGSEKYLLQTEDGHRLMVDSDEVRDFDTSETLGRPVYQAEDEPADTYEGEHTTELGADVGDLVEGL